MMTLMKFYEGDEVRVREDKIPTLFYSNPEYLIEDRITEPESFLKRSVGIVIECDWDKRKKQWSHFIEFRDKTTFGLVRLWFLESELREVS